MIVKFHATLAGDDGSFREGDVIDLPPNLAKKYLAVMLPSSRPGCEKPVATVVTNPAERARAKPYIPPIKE